MSEVSKKYVVVKWGFNKDTGLPYSAAYELKLDRSQPPKYSYLDSKSVIYLEEIREIGDIVEAVTTIS